MKKLVRPISFTLSKPGQDEVIMGTSFDDIIEFFGENGVLDFSHNPEFEQEEKEIRLNLSKDQRFDPDKSYRELTSAEKHEIFPTLLEYYQDFLHKVAKSNGYTFRIII
uniref:Uncharacterized protein n=1 Tax=Strigamia maritima TaxID=126957 RepID=T1JJ97_STRMM